MRLQILAVLFVAGQTLLSGPAFSAQTGVSAPRPNILFILAADPGETKNLYRDHPDIVARLTKLFEQLRDAKRSR